MSTIQNQKNKKNYKTAQQRERTARFSYLFWLVFGGILSIGLIFFMSMILTISILGTGMATQGYRLMMYLFYGDDRELSPAYHLSKVKNTIWIILGGWLLYCFHMILGGLWYITYVGKPVAKMWFGTAKLVLFPFGVDITIDNTVDNTNS